MKSKASKFKVLTVTPGRARGDFVVEVALEVSGFATVRVTESRVSTTGFKVVSTTSPLGPKHELMVEKAVASMVG